jgi:hypothetical protein
VKTRKRLGIGYAAAMLALVSICAGAEKPSETANKHAVQSGEGKAAEGAPEASATLVREVVYNELHDHDAHGYWRYWIEKHAGQGTSVAEQVETADGPVTRVQMTNGRPISAEANADEVRRLSRLLASPNEQAEHRKAYAEDEHRIGRILALLPDAFLYEPAREERLGDVACWHMRFQPNPAYPAHSIEARIFHAMTGDLWIGVDSKRLVRLDGKLEENVDFGYGILGRLYKGGWFRLERTQVSSGSVAGDWKTQRLEVHMQGRAMLFKTIARETSEVRGGFTPVPAGLSLKQAVTLVRPERQQPVNAVTAQPASLRRP